MIFYPTKNYARTHIGRAVMAVIGFHSCSEFIIYITFMLFGLSVMMASNAIGAAPSFITEYYKYVLGDPNTAPEDPAFWVNVLTYYNVAVYGMQVVCEVFMLTPLGRSIPLRPRLIVGLVIPFAEILALIFVPIGKGTEAGAKATIMTIAVVGGLSKTLCDSSTGALAGPFPTKFYGAVVCGIGASGLITSAMSMIIKVSMSNDFDGVLAQSRIYFGVAMLLQLSSCILLVIMPRNAFARKYTAEFRYAYERRKGKVAEDGEAHAEEGMQDKNEPTALLEDASGSPDAKGHKNVLDAVGDADKMKDVDQVDNITSTQQMLNAQISSVFKIIWPMLLSCFVVYGATLLIYPGVFFAVKAGEGWYMTILVAMFNLGDFVSRLFLLLKRLQPSPHVVLIGSFLRLLIVPPLVLCVRGYIPGPELPYILCLIWGLTNGYFGGMAMLYSTRTPLLTMAGQRSIAAIMCSLSLPIGLFVGSSLALAVKEGLVN